MERLRASIREKTQFYCSAGIANNKVGLRNRASIVEEVLGPLWATRFRVVYKGLGGWMCFEVLMVNKVELGTWTSTV